MAGGPHFFRTGGAQDDRSYLPDFELAEGVEALADQRLAERITLGVIVEGDGSDAVFDPRADEFHGCLRRCEESDAARIRLQQPTAQVCRSVVTGRSDWIRSSYFVAALFSCSTMGR